ncbi:MAG: type 1 glutamine amidotransferase [Burkholderiales bacterium]
MKPVCIVRFAATEGPAWFADWLDGEGIPRTEIRIDRGDAVPADASEFSGLAMMGGPMSVNDPLPWIEPMLGLIRDADARNVPVIGHCLGGQLMSCAFGGTVSRNRMGNVPTQEIGWSSVNPTDTPEARDWFGDAEQLTVFQWHGETFSIPPGAVRLASNELCANQAFVRGPHLAMQFHVEMDEPTIASWCDNGATEIADAHARGDTLAVQAPSAILTLTGERLPQMRRDVSERVYRRWAQGLEARVAPAA